MGEVIWGASGVKLVGDEGEGGGSLSVLTSGERLLLRECLEEAFLYYSLPLSVSFSLGAAALWDQGALRPFRLANSSSVARSRLYKASVAGGFGVLGFSLGQLVFSSQCSSKFLAREPMGVVARDIMMKSGLQTLPYSVFSPVNQAKWRELARQKLAEQVEPGFQIHPEFREQNVLSPNVISPEEGPVRYGIYQGGDKSISHQDTAI